MPFIGVYIDFNKPDADIRASGLFVSDVSTYTLKSPKQQWPMVSLEKRDVYPRTFCVEQGPGYFLGYGSRAESIEEEFFHVTIRADEISITRDIYATVPMFYSYEAGIFVASNEFGWVVERTTTLTPNDAYLLEAIAFPNSDRHTTSWKQIKILDEQTTLRANAKTVSIEVSSPRSRQALLSNPKDFPRIITEVLDDFATKYLQDGRPAYEVSGGIDSALVPLYGATRRPAEGQLIGSLVLPGALGKSQQVKLDDITRYTDGATVQALLNVTDDMPLSRFATTVQPFYSYEEIYTEPLTRLAKILQGYGVTTLAVGIGGDELFENIPNAAEELMYGSTERQRRENMALPPYVTSAFRQSYIESTPSDPPYPLPWLAVSLHGAQLARNNVYLRHGIWPVSPFVHPMLYEYCQGLPIHFRANKNILRAYYEAQGWPKSIYNPSQNEHFGDFFDDALNTSAFSTILSRYISHSYAGDKGYIDTHKLADYYAATDQDKHWLFDIYTWLCVELNLQNH